MLKSYNSENGKNGGGAGELYTYLPITQKNEDVLSKVPPQFIKKDPFGFEVGRGAWTFPKGAWTTIAERVKLNDPGKTNGTV